ncbi:MAG: CHASE2 domain-containing protein [Fibrobacterota bacterium]|nr:CHASE2 domain-containing protein [Fibrobacterota bacterium]QQS04040.1 MAG: CHASE2 domain-containing protein [Fibrobacterota bacterium]
MRRLPLRLTTRSRRFLFSIAACWAALLACTAVEVVLPGPVARLEGILTDFRHDVWRILFGPGADSPVSPAIVIDIDERTLRSLGAYGESYRPHQAKVLAFLARHGAGAVALDVLFKTQDDVGTRLDATMTDLRASGWEPPTDSHFMQRLRERMDGSGAIAAVLAKSNRIVLAAQLSHPQEYANPSDWIPRANRSWQDSVWPGVRLPSEALHALSGRAAMDNIAPGLARASGVLGLANIEPDPDGTVRRLAMLWRYPDTVLIDPLLGPSGSAEPRAYPGLALRSALVLLGRREDEFSLAKGRLELGAPLRIWKDSSGIRTSIPELTWPMCQAIARHRSDFDSIVRRRQGRIEPTSQIWIRRDPSGALSVRLAYPDTLDEATVLALAATTDSVLAGAPSSGRDTLLLTDSVALVRSGGSVELLRLVSDSQPPQATVIGREDLGFLLDGIRPLAAGGWNRPAPGEDLRVSSWIETWWNPWKGRLESSLPALHASALHDLANLGNDATSKLNAGDTVSLGVPISISVDDRGSALVPFQAPSVWEGLSPDRAWIRRISFVDVLEGRMDPALVPGRLFVIGSAATALSDFVDIPIQRRHPGVCVQAATALSLVWSDTLVASNRLVELLVAFLIATLYAAASSRLSPWGALAACLGVVAALFAGSVALFDHGVWTGLFLPATTIVTGFVAILAIRYLLEERQKRFLHASFGTYISPHLIERMVESGRLPSLGGEERSLTAFFSDIQGFSSISEALSPTDLVELINEYLSVTTRILLDRGGTLDKYIGDAIVAMFGAPVELDDHAGSALLTAIAMQDALAELRAKWKNEGSRWPDLVHGMRMRIGIHSGRIVTGNMGSDLRMNYTMMGDDVNLAARLESACKHYGTWILTTDATMALAGDAFLAREIDRVRVVGKSEAVTTWEVLGERDRCPESWTRCVETWNRARSLYMAGSFPDARDLFLECEALEPFRGVGKTTPSQVFVQRCEEYTTSPPSEFWDGSHTAREK